MFQAKVLGKIATRFYVQ